VAGKIAAADQVQANGSEVFGRDFALININALNGPATHQTTIRDAVRERD
jgi:hypothetical protein